MAKAFKTKVLNSTTKSRKYQIPKGPNTMVKGFGSKIINISKSFGGPKAMRHDLTEGGRNMMTPSRKSKR